ncbi:MAG TPA: ABC transporter ATP-binding protein [Planctomycetes bacterium]|nr:ABC transporter ATP-binding protein [Planctomycetota bacterium]
MILLDHVYKSFGGREVLKDMCLHVAKGECFVIMGRSGIGKSVTLKHVIGVVTPDKGKVIVDGVDVPNASRKELSELRKRIGYLFQSGALINWLNVFENVALPLREHKMGTEEEIRERVMEKLRLVEMEHTADVMPENLSGGMKKRVGLARALVMDPQILLYDEPNAGLDPVMSETINHLIVNVQQKLRVTSIVVTHRLGCAFTVGDRIGLLDSGRIIEEGTPDEIRNSVNPLVRRFVQGVID